MLNDPRVAPPPPTLDIHALRGLLASPHVPSHTKTQAAAEYMRSQGIKIGEPTEEQRKTQQRVDALVAQIQAEKQHAHAQNQAALLNERFAKGQQNTAINVGHMLGAGASMPMMPRPGQASFPSVGAMGFPPSGQPRLDETGPVADQAQKYGLDNMNPIAREKYEPIFKLLDIKIRFTNTLYGTSRQWLIAKQPTDQGARMIRMEWSSPSTDPGCALATWDAMVAELLDEVARRGDAKQRLPDSAGVASTGQ